MSDLDSTLGGLPAPEALPRWRRIAGQALLGGPVALVIPIAFAILLLLFPFVVDDAYWVRQISLIVVLALVISGLNLSFGYAGELQFGQVFMFAFGAYVTMILAGRVTDEIIPLLLIGGLAASLVGAVIAFPALRIGGWSLALTSFFLIIVIPELVSIFGKYTGGSGGLIDIPTPHLLGRQLTTTGLYVVTIVVAIIWFAIFRNLMTSRYGVIFRILRESPVLANSLGFSTRSLKLMAYMMGAFPAGMAGCLFGFITLIITPSSFGFDLAIGVVAGSLLGGIESVYGGIIAAAILQLGPQSSLSFAEYAPAAYGAFLIFAAIAFRHGLGGLGKRVGMRASRLLVGDVDAARTTSAGSLSAHVMQPDSRGPSTPVAGRDAVTIAPIEGHRLTVASVSKAFGGNKALDEVSLTAQPGQVTALIGANGSGKTTMLNLICGYVKGDSGEISLGEETLTGGRPDRIARLGVGRTFQTPSVPRGVSVLDVVASGGFSADRCGPITSTLRLPRYWRSRRADREDALELLALVGLDRLADQAASNLSLGTRRLVEVARALRAKPALLLLDEPASGLSGEEVELLGRVISTAADAGVTVVLIEHNFAFVTAVSDHAHVLNFGRLIASGSPATIAKDPLVIESFLGQVAEETDEAPASAPEVDESARPRPRRPDAVSTPLLEMHDVVSGYGDLRVLRGVSLALEPGKVEVLLGRNGAGKTTLLNTITGQLRVWQGGIRLEGRELGRTAAYRRAGMGIALVQEGKRVFRERTIAENVALGTFTQSLSRRERRRRCDSVLESFPILRQRSDERAAGLSGGQQQMLAIAQALASGPRLLLLDEPSAGLAPAIVREVFDQVAELCAQGITILLVEQLADQALRIADHVSVLDSGELVASGPPEQFHDQRGLRKAYFGDAVAAPGEGAARERNGDPHRT